jgi:hypothetical protein
MAAVPPRADFRNASAPTKIHPRPGGQSGKVGALKKRCSRELAGSIPAPGISPISTLIATRIDAPETRERDAPETLAAVAAVVIAVGAVAVRDRQRYVDLRLGPASGAAIKNGGTIPTTDTTSAVDLDQLFNTLNGPTRKGSRT